MCTYLLQVNSSPKSNTIDRYPNLDRNKDRGTGKDKEATPVVVSVEVPTRIRLHHKLTLMRIGIEAKPVSKI